MTSSPEIVGDEDVDSPNLSAQASEEYSSAVKPTPSSPGPIRQNTAPLASPSANPRPKNLRNLTLPSLVSPSASSSSATTLQPGQYQSLAEGAANIAGLPPIHDVSTPGTPSFLTKPGTPLLRPGTPGTPSLAPRTPLLSRTPLSPSSPLPSAAPPTSTTTKTPTTAKGKLKSFLPRSHHEAHSYFLAKIEVQQLANVPFVRGEFGVRWKLRNSVGLGEVKASDKLGGQGEEAGLLGKMKARSHNKGKAKDDHQGASEFGLSHPLANGSSPSLISEVSQHSNSMNSYSSYSSTDSYSSRSTSFGTSGSGASIATNTTTVTSTPSSTATRKTKVAPSGNLSRNFFSPPTGSPNSTSPNGYGINQYLFSSTSTSKAYEESLLFSPTYQQSFASNAALGVGAIPTSPGLDGPLSPGMMNALSPTGTITQANAGSHPLGFGVLSPRDGTFAPGGIPEANLSPPRGITPYKRLKDHSITFAYPLNAIIKFDIARNSNQQGNPKHNLSPSEFKLVVMQRVIPDDPDGVPQNPRLGAVYLNLAEYVGKGKVERRYLLKESRVNATLKISIEMTYVSGNTDYIAPPLPKAEIMGDIENFLAQNDTLYKQRTKDIYAYTYGPYRDKEELDMDLLGRVDGLEDEATLAEDRLKDPYALPSESESELDEQGSSAAVQARRDFLRSLNIPLPAPAPPKAPSIQSDKESEKARRRLIRREERRQKFRLELETNPSALPPVSGESASESEVDADTESDADAFESAPEDDGVLAMKGAGDDDSVAHTDDGQSSLDHDRQHHPRSRRHQHVELAAFDVQRLPVAYGPKTTEALIDAIFNPTVTTDKRRENPFTVYMDPEELDAMSEQERRMLMMQYGGPHVQGMMAGMPMNPGFGQPPPVGRSFSRDTTSTSTTTSESGGSGGNDEGFFGRLKSPGEETIVGVPTKASTGLGLGIEGVLAGQTVGAGGIPLDRDRDATIGRASEKVAGGGVGAMLHQYYRSRKEKIKEVRKKAKPRRSETASTSASEDSHVYYQNPYGQSANPATNVLGSPVYFQEPSTMDDEQSDFSKHQRNNTGGTVEIRSLDMVMDTRAGFPLFLL
ncbi:hypothetical protein CC1G_09498 [Coprinopsis cinerea okayama7|uniref:C2 NT-type domain-containing protein n=1 Tax=Coprinopsis cinerea (strain Okayama-7 / 130 / ATCC MYA-4618 / FGSC 9003) TaxID=240176 RepID=A8P0R4_COPC7|nr:hypothetical protein CC1G_09498 [Coprinopsis cinerea okayama7\|eukprot:XP_001837947.1 hypothetical protein CC1G_09498 [Coprinopsis cinerea okayama7\